MDYEVKIVSRHVGGLNEWKKKSGVEARTGTFEEAADFAEVIVLAVKGSVAENLVHGLASRLTGKTVINTTNPISELLPEMECSNISPI
jgi:8-hydroxy-5-deazaflavin:NADPH oxidoreductase